MYINPPDILPLVPYMKIQFFTLLIQILYYYQGCKSNETQRKRISEENHRSSIC